MVVHFCINSREIWIAFTFPVFGGLWHCYEVCIYNYATLHYKTGAIKTGIYVYKDFLSNPVCLEHMAELKQRFNH